MGTTYDARIWKTEQCTGQRGTTYKVRWVIAGRPRKKAFRTKALADSFRSELVTALRKGRAFDTITGHPALGQEVTHSESWYVFACSYVDMKWPDSAGKSRMGIAETLATVTPILAQGRGRPSEQDMRAALYGWAFNTRARANGKSPPEIARVTHWLEKHTMPVSELMNPDVMRSILARIGRKLDGQPAAASTIGRKRAVFHNALEYAVERELLPQNPLTALKTKKSQTVEAVDKRIVVSPHQAVRLL
ncbi:MAG: tyrosine-type recombinase/integrase, partial [Pseudonocardiaceae bacterium]